MTVVHDPFGAARDPSMPFLAHALDPAKAEAHLGRLLDGAWRVRTIRVMRHKPKTRCLVEYDLSKDDGSETLTVLGKARAWGLDAATYRVCGELWRRGFSEANGDGVSVPRPLGMVPEFHMWFQHKVPGTPAGELLSRPEGIELAPRIAEAVHKLHASGVPTPRRHTIRDELNILHERLAAVAESRREWAHRLEDLLAFCDRLAASIPEAETRGVHRDFYQDHVIVHGGRLYLLDLDLYARGDPAVDAGNFLAHLTEWSLRGLGDPDALADRQEAFQRRFLELVGDDRGTAVETYAFLSLVRHISISAQIPDRRPLTESILRLCEARRRDLAPMRA